MWRWRSLPPAIARTRPQPRFRFQGQSRSHRVPLHIIDNRPQLVLGTNPVVIILTHPERSARSSDNPIGTVAGGCFQPTHDLRQMRSWPDYEMNVIRHHHPCDQFISLPDTFAISQRIDYYLRDTWVFQPARSGNHAVQLPVPCDEFFSRIGIAYQKRE